VLYLNYGSSFNVHVGEVKMKTLFSSNTDLTKDGAMSAIVGKLVAVVLDTIVTKLSGMLEKFVEAKLVKWLGDEIVVSSSEEVVGITGESTAEEVEVVA
jgi:hypothetical protein